MARAAFLLGAGASFPFGIPMMREFYESFRAYVKLSRTHCFPLLEQLTNSATHTVDLEYLIQQIERVRGIKSGLSALGQDAGNMADHLHHADELRGYLDMFLIETCENFDRRKVESIFSRLVRLAHDENAFIFSTNYDRLVEVSAASLNLQCSDGFEPMSSLPESNWTGAFSEKLRLIKLHGSVNWYEEEQSERLYRLERGYSLPSHEYRLSHGDRALKPLMIIPTLEKAILKPPYTALLTQFGDALKDIDVLIVIGNSLRDDHLRGLIIERSSNLEIILVNPTADSQLNVVRHPSKTHAVVGGVEAFIDLGLEGLKDVLNVFDVLNSENIEKFKIDLKDYVQKVSSLIAERESSDFNDSVRDELERISVERVDLKLDAIRTLSKPVHPLVLRKLRDFALSETQDEMIRVSSIDALAVFEGTSASEIFYQIAQSSETPFLIRAEAALALKSLCKESGSAAEIFLKLTQHENSQDLTKLLETA